MRNHMENSPIIASSFTLLLSMSQDILRLVLIAQKTFRGDDIKAAETRYLAAPCVIFQFVQFVLPHPSK